MALRSAFGAPPVRVLSRRFAQVANVWGNGGDDVQPHNGHHHPTFPTFLPFNPPVLVDPLETSTVHPSTSPAVTGDMASAKPIDSYAASIHSSTFAEGPPATTSSVHNSVIGQVATSATASAKFASSTVSPATSSSSSGAIAGGVVVGLIGFAMLVCAVVFLVRRSRRHRDDQFNANEFRRSAVLMPDLPTHDDVINRGFHLHSPFMAERKTLPLRVQKYPSPDVNNRSELVTNPIASPVPPSPSATAGHSQPGDPTSAPSSFVTRQQFNPSPSRRASRPASGSDPGAANGFTFPRRQPLRVNTAFNDMAEPKLVVEQVLPDDYVDLSRSGVHQAAQHGEIAKRVSTQVAHSHHDNETATSSLTRTIDDPASPPKSPFEGSTHESMSSGQSLARGQTPELQDFPVPPSPASTMTSRYRISMPPDFPEPTPHSRIDSLPPVLPELDLGNRNSQLGERPLSSSFMKRKSLVAKYKSSPLASNGIVAGADQGSNVEAVVSPQIAAVSESATPKRPETVYDPNDAYAGIHPV